MEQFDLFHYIYNANVTNFYHFKNDVNIYMYMYLKSVFYTNNGLNYSLYWCYWLLYILF